MTDMNADALSMCMPLPNRGAGEGGGAENGYLFSDGGAVHGAQQWQP